jgi:FixJ family two-component response regulator
MAANPLESPGASTPIVCVVDQDGAVRDGVRALLRTLGAEVRTYSTATDFLRDIRARSPVCVIADMNLPELTGLELMVEMKRRGLDVPTILLSSEGDVATAVSAMRSGALDFIEKPNIDRALMKHLPGLLRRDPKTER